MKQYGLNFQRTYNPDDPTDLDVVSIQVFEIAPEGEAPEPFAEVRMSGETWTLWRQIAAAVLTVEGGAE